jgi:PTH2 family peptidyl-tRNA hydrolase
MPELDIIVSISVKINDALTSDWMCIMGQEVKQVIVVRKDLTMRKGKMCAQVAHASMKFLFENNDAEKLGEIKVKLSKPEMLWMNSGHAKIVVGCDSEEELRSLMSKAELFGVDSYSITDAGHTEFHGVPTLTAAAFGPDYSDVIDEITGKLKLL